MAYEVNTHELVKSIFDTLGVKPFEEFTVDPVGSSSIFKVLPNLQVFYIANTNRSGREYTPSPFDISDMLNWKKFIKKLEIPTKANFNHDYLRWL